MREILFRGKCGRNGDEWIEGGIAFGYFVEGDVCILSACGSVLSVYPETVGQYTGLTDKNGKKIFEGDIVRADNGHISKVVFWYGGFSLYCECHKQHTDFIPKDIIEILGNIHDNPELLKEKE